LLVFAWIGTGACKSRDEKLREQQAEIEDDKARRYLSAAASEQALYERQEILLAAETARLDQELVIDEAKSDINDVVQAILGAERAGGADAGLEVLAARKDALADVLARAHEARARLLEFDAGEFPRGAELAPAFRLKIEELDELSRADADVVCHASNPSRNPSGRTSAGAKLCDELRSLLGFADAGP